MNSEKYPPYFRPYIDKIPEGQPLDLLRIGIRKTLSTLAMVGDEQANGSYAAGKWSIKDIIQHLIDTERIFCFRALSFARGEVNNLNGYEHDKYVTNANANQRSLKGLLEEYKSLRISTVAMFESFDKVLLMKKGNANGLDMSAEQVLHILIGHELHHMSVIEERYL